MKSTERGRSNLNHLALALALSVGLGAATARAQTILDVGGVGTIGDTTLSSADVPATGTNWTAAGGAGFKYSNLISPPVTVTTTGPVTLTFNHRYFIEEAWDGGAVFVSVNGEPAAYLPETAFTAGGYDGDTLANTGAAWPGGEKVFYSKSAGYDTPELIESVAVLGDLNAGDTVSVHFRGGWDGAYAEAAPNWEMGTVQISDTGGTLLDADFTANGESGFTVVSDSGLAGPWTYLKPISRFEIDGDALTADRYAPVTPGSVIDLNDAHVEVVLLAGALDVGDSFTLFDLSGGTTLTGNFGSFVLPPGTWDTSSLMVDGSITLTLLPPLYTAGVDFEVNAFLDTNGNDVWEDTVGIAGVEFFLDSTNGVNRVATTTATRLPYAYDFPGGFSGDTPPDDPEAGYGGGKLVTTGETGECRSFSEVGWHANDATLEFWIKPDNLTPVPANGQVIFEDGGGAGFGLFLGANQIYTAQDNNNAGDGQISYDLSTDPLGVLIAPATTEFMQVVLTRVGSTGEVEMFVNGVSVGTATALNGGGWSGGDGFGLGARGEANVGGQGAGDDGTESFDGQIALFRIYNNQILTPTEVANNFADIYGPNDPYMAATLTSPFDGENLVSGTSVVASAKVIDPGTAPYSVEFWVDGSLAGTAATADPYTLDLGALPDGSHEVYVKFIDSSAPSPLVATTATHTFTLAPATSTTITLGSSENPSTYGSGTVTATIVAANSTPLTGGTVQFYDGGSPLGDPVPVDTGTGQASYSIAMLGVGTHEITADYSGWGVHNASSASALSQVVGVVPLTVTANNVFRPTGTENLDPLPYKITGFQNGESLATSGVTGEPFLSTAASIESPAGDYDIICALGTLDAINYSFTLVNGTLTVADVADTFSVNFYANGALPAGEARDNLRLEPGEPAGLADWLSSGWANIAVPWAPASPQPPVTLTSNRGSSATFTLITARNGGPYVWNVPRTTLLDDGNGTLMDAHVNSTEDSSKWFDMEVTDIPFDVYDVIFYIGANQAQFGDGKGNIVFNGGPVRKFTLSSGAFDGTFTEMVDETTPGNYVVFTGVTGSSFTTRTWGDGFNHLGPTGFQIRAGISDYGTWAGNFPDADLSDPDADYDGDGVNNDGERLFGLDPTDSSSVNPYSSPLDAGAFSFTRRDNDLTGKFTDIETSTDLVMWTADSGATLVDNGPDASGVEIVDVNLSEGLLSAPKLFVRVNQGDGILLSENFESGNGGFTVATTAGSDWVWGDPDSAGPGGSVTEGNGGSINCWGTNIGNPGYYITPTETCLRSVEVDLTNVAAAELTFAEALDLQTDDKAVVNIIESATNTIIAPEIYRALDSDVVQADWGMANGGTSIPIPAAALGKKVRIEWCLTGNTTEYFGWYVDDVTVKRVAPDVP